MRSTPVSRSWPIVERRTPSRIIAAALRSDPRASTTAKASPATMSEKYSAAPKRSASLVSGTARAATTRVPSVPAKNEPIAAIASAAPARPCFAIACPSSVVTTAVTSPGMFTRIAVVDAREEDDRAGRLEPEGDRQEHGDRRDGADPREHADERPDEAADERE